MLRGASLTDILLAAPDFTLPCKAITSRPCLLFCFEGRSIEGELNSSAFWLQLCTEEIWQGTMEQIPKLGIQPAELPEEALTQIYQVYFPPASTGAPGTIEPFA